MNNPDPTEIGQYQREAQHMQRFSIPSLIISITTLLLTADSATAQKISAESAPDWNALFDRSSGWTGADGIYAIPLNGREIPDEDHPVPATFFLFSDTFVGEVDEEGNRLPGTTMVNNTAALLLGTDPLDERITFIVRKDSDGKPRALVVPDTPNSEPDHWYWFQDGIALDETLHAFTIRMKPGDGGVFNFAVDGVARISTPIDHDHPFTEVTQTELPLFLEANDNRGEIIYGTSFMPNTEAAGSPNPDGYIYIYGTQNDLSKKLVAARVEPEQFTDPSAWRFWDGTEWNPDIETSAPLTNRISSEISVSPLPNGRYILVFQNNALGREVAIRVGESPIGPWGPAHKIYHCPEPDRDKDIFVYNAKAHPHLSDEGELLISYNINTFDFWDHFKYADIYRPRFIRLKLDQL